jgi:hypothetical protein
MVLFGWALEITQRVANDYTDELPDWNRIGDYFAKGIVGTIAYIAYLAPVWLIGLIFQFPAATLTSSQSSAAQAAGTLFALCLVIPQLALYVGALFLLWIATVRYAANEDIKSFLEVRENFEFVKQHWPTLSGTFITLAAVSIGLFFLYLIALFTICGAMFLTSYTFAFYGFVFGNLGKQLNLVYEPGEDEFWAVGSAAQPAQIETETAKADEIKEIEIQEVEVKQDDTDDFWG